MAIPNTTPTPNELYNGEMNKMGDTELRVVLIVTRATLGWEIDPETGTRKEEDWINYYQLKQKSGRGYTALAKAINNCIEKGWIEARDGQDNLLDTKNKRVGKKIFYRLGRIFLDKIEIPETSSESEEVKKKIEPTSSESEITESEAYKRNTITKDTLYMAKQKFSSLKDINDSVIEEISLDYKVPLSFVKLELEKLRNYCEAKGKIYKNYKAALKKFVLDDAQKQVERISNDKYRAVDARNL